MIFVYKCTNNVKVLIICNFEIYYKMFVFGRTADFPQSTLYLYYSTMNTSWLQQILHRPHPDQMTGKPLKDFLHSD